MPLTTFLTVNGNIYSQKKNGARTHFIHDALGSVAATVSDGGSVVNKYTYKPYGELLSKTGVGEDPKFLWVGGPGYRTTGRRWAEKYVRRRHYGEQQGMWTTIDPLWPEESVYGYVTGNPSSLVDPTGTQSSKLKPHGDGWQPIASPHRIKFRGLENSWLPSLRYGAYCGADVIQNPGSQIIPQDCVDACCQIHDRCLEAHYAFGYGQIGGHICCEDMMIKCLKGIIESEGKRDCCSKSEDPAACRLAAKRIKDGMVISRNHYRALGIMYLGDGKIDCLYSPPDGSGYWVYVHEHWANPKSYVPCGKGADHPLLGNEGNHFHPWRK